MAAPPGFRPDRSKAIIGTLSDYGCGCSMWQQPYPGEPAGESVLIFRPCSPHCWRWLYYQAAAVRSGKFGGAVIGP